MPGRVVSFTSRVFYVNYFDKEDINSQCNRQLSWSNLKMNAYFSAIQKVLIAALVTQTIKLSLNCQFCCLQLEKVNMEILPFQLSIIFSSIPW